MFFFMFLEFLYFVVLDLKKKNVGHFLFFEFII